MIYMIIFTIYVGCCFEMGLSSQNKVDRSNGRAMPFQTARELPIIGTSIILYDRCIYIINIILYKHVRVDMPGRKS